MNKGMIITLVIGIIIGATIVSVVWNLSSSGKECFPMSSGEQRSFHFLEIDNCFKMDKNTCWINETQYGKFESTFSNRHYTGTDFGNGRLFFMMGNVNDAFEVADAQ